MDVILWSVRAIGSQSQSDTLMPFLAGVVVGMVIAFLFDHYLLAFLAHWWAQRARLTRGR